MVAANLRTAVLPVLVLTALLMLVPVSPNERSQTTLVSYNSPPGNRFHAPLSDMAMIDFANATPVGGPSVFSSTLATSSPLGQGIRGNFLRFLTDQSYFPQTETSIAVDPSNTNHIVGGFNDQKFLFCRALPSDCLGSFPGSATGFTTSTDGGKTVAKSDDLPNISRGNLLVSFGDPSVVAGTDGNFFFGSLVFGSSGGNGIMVAKSNQDLFNNTVACTTSLLSPDSNPCWKSVFVFGSLVPFGTIEDKDLLAVDRDPASPFFGSLYVAWDHFDSSGLSSSYVARCDSSLSACQMVSGGLAPPISGQDPFVAFTTPAVDKHGNVYVTWCNYGTFTTFGPVTCKIASSGPGGTSFGPATTILSFMGPGTTLPTYTTVLGWASEQFRTTSVPTLAVDNSPASDNLYFGISLCSSGHYYAATFVGPDNPGLCGLSSIVFSLSRDKGSTWSFPATISSPAVNDQPYITVDAVNGQVFVLYYTTQFDPFNHRIDVVALRSVNEGRDFVSRRITSVSNEPDADPNMYDYLAAGGTGGSFSVPQYGDYFQAVAQGVTLWVLFTANYAVEQGAFQTDPFLSTINY